MMKYARVKLLACLLVLALFTGCQSAESYRVLSFFFDGVPEPGQDSKTREASESGKKEKKVAVKNVQHGPYGAKLCTACHSRGTNTLILPVEKLCSRCHEFNMENKFVHGPLVSGGCRLCHEPHSSPYEFLLTEDSKSFCLKCHEKNDVFKNEVHNDTMSECTDCHAAHMSGMKYLLK